MVFLVGVVVFYMMVLFVLGILFWEWWTPELAMLGLLATRWRKPDVAHIFTRRERFLSPLLIICAMPVFWPYALGWLDSPYTIVYDLEVREEGSETWLELNRGDMDPYNLSTPGPKAVNFPSTPQAGQVSGMSLVSPH